ncbi:tape measure protein [Rhodobacter phage RcZahn]|nr:tape measure protein [Rhodobacter phage RcZahn]
MKMTPRGAELQFLLRMRDEASRVVRSAAQQMRQLGTSSGQASRGVRDVTHRMTELNQSVELLNRTMHVFERTVGSSLRSFSNYDKNMTIVRRITIMSREEMARFSDQFDEMTDRLRAVPVDRLGVIATQAAQLGITGTDNILEFTEVVAMLETSLVDLGEEAPKLIVRVLNATGEGIAGIERFGNVMVRMAKSASASEERILQMTSQLAQSTAQFDVSAASLLGLATAAADLNFAPELFGSATQRTMTQLYEAALNNTQGMRSLSAMTGLTADEFKRLMETDPAEGLIVFAEAMDAVGDDGRSLLQFLTMFNLQADENRRILGSVSQNVDMFRRRLAEARLEAELQIALNQEFGTTLEAFFAQTQAAANAWELFKKQFGAALAPVATMILNGLTTTLIEMREVLQGMPTWAQGLVAWTAIAIPALIAASVAVRALITVFGILGASTVGQALLMVTAGVRVLIVALIRLTIVAGQAAAALLLLGGRAVLGGLAAGATAIGAWIAGLVRVAAFVAVMAGFGRIVAVIAQAFAIVGSAIAAVGAALGGLSAGAAIAIAAVVAAVAGAGYAIYDRWDQIRQDVMSGTRSWAGAIANAMWEGIKDGLDWAKTSIQSWFDEGVTIGGGSSPIDQDAVRQALEGVYAERFALQDSIGQMVANSAPQEMIDRAQTQLDALTDRAMFLGDIMAHLSGMPIDQASADVQALFSTPQGAPQVPTAADVGLDPRMDIDTSVLSRISDENRQVITDMDDYSQVLAEVEKQMIAIQQLWSLPTNDPFFASMGLEPDEVQDYIRRLQGLAEFRLQDANPVNTRLRELQEEAFMAEQVTATGRQQLEIEQAIIALQRQRGALTADEIAEVSTAMRAVFTAQRDAAIANEEFDLTRQIVQAQALTREQRNRADITVRLMELERELGALTQEQVDRITAMMQQLQALQADSTFRNRTIELNDQLAMANAIFQVEKNELAIAQEIAAYERENGTLSAERRAQLEGQLRALQQMQNITATITSLDPRAGAFISYIDNLNNLQSALDAGAISQEYYNQLVAQMERNMEQALDPLFQMRQTLADNVALQSIMGPGADAERAALQQINELRRQGFELTESQIDAIRRLHQAMAQLSLVQSSGLEGWADEIGTVTERILDMQKSLADSLSSSLVDAIYGAEDAWSQFFLNASKMFTDFFLDTAMQQFADWLGNDLGGLLPGVPTQAGAAAEAAAAQQEVDSILRQIVQAQQVDIAANIVNLQGFSQGAMGNPLMGGTAGGFTGDAATLLQSIATGGATRPDAISGLNAGFGNQLAEMVAAAQAQFGPDAVSITSAFRSVERQRELWEQALQQYGSPEEARRWVAPPGQSSHNFGMAADLGYRSPEVEQWFHQNAGQFGLDYRMGNEPWHIEPQGARGMIGQMQTGQIPNVDLSAATEALTSLSDTARITGTDLTTAATSLDTAGVAARGAGTDVSMLGTNASLAGNQTAMAGQSTQMMGLNAQMSTMGVTQSAAATSRLGNEAAAAAPRITQAANALGQAGSGLGGGLFQGFGTALVGFGLGLLGNALSRKSNKQTKTVTYETPNVAITKLHGGGIAGRDGLGKAIDYASAYISAPRYHDGLQSNEFRAVLERGERVLTERDNKRVERVLERVGSGDMGGSRAAPNVNMYVTTPDAGSFKQAQSSIMARTHAGMSRAAARRG